MVHNSVIIHQNRQKKITNIVKNDVLKHLFDGSDSVKNESDIITASGFIVRPDRLNFHKHNSVTVTDYKTGRPKIEHEDQINGYAMALKEMGFSISEKILVYVQGEEIVINKV